MLPHNCQLALLGISAEPAFRRIAAMPARCSKYLHLPVGIRGPISPRWLATEAARMLGQQQRCPVGGFNRERLQHAAQRGLSTRVRAATAVAPQAAGSAQERLQEQVAVVLGTQWGDEGKGKLVDILAQQYDIVARAQVRAAWQLSRWRGFTALSSSALHQHMSTSCRAVVC